MVSKLITKMNDTDYKGERLIFAETTDGNFTIENKDFESLGTLEKMRCGAWMTWWLFLNDRCGLTAGCQDEVREMTKHLNAKITETPRTK